MEIQIADSKLVPFFQQNDVQSDPASTIWAMKQNLTCEFFLCSPVHNFLSSSWLHWSQYLESLLNFQMSERCLKYLHFTFTLIPQWLENWHTAAFWIYWGFCLYSSTCWWKYQYLRDEILPVVEWKFFSNIKLVKLIDLRSSVLFFSCYQFLTNRVRFFSDDQYYKHVCFLN